MKRKSSLKWLRTGMALTVALSTNLHLAFAQDCNALFMHKTGNEAELTSYSATHVVIGKNVTRVEEVKDDGKLHVIKTTMTHYTVAGQANSVSNLTYVCNDTVTRQYYDNDAISAKMYKDMEDMVATKKGKGFAFNSVTDPIEFPLQLKEGMTLKPYETFSVVAFQVTEKQLKEVGLPMGVNVNNSGGQYDHTVVTHHYIEKMVDLGVGVSTRTITDNIQVGPMESITVPAGTYNCFKITADMYTMTVTKKETGHWIFGTITQKINAPKQQIVQWFCPGIGQVKLEIHGADDKIVISNELTKLTN